MLKEIEFTGPFEVSMYKKLYGPNEIALANCMGLEIVLDNDWTIVKADLFKTSIKALFEFISEAFQSLVHNPQNEHLKNNLKSELLLRYGQIFEKFSSELLVNVPYRDKLYKHQLDGAFTSAYKQYNFLAYEMRCGKTLTAATISRMWNIKRTLIVCPSGAKWNWFRELTNPDIANFNEMYFTILDSAKRNELKAFQERFILVNYDIVGKKLEDVFEGGEIGHIILDECFLYDTIIRTSDGLIKIGDIVENKIKTNCLCYDSLNDVYLYKPITNWLKKPLIKNLVKIKYNGGELICTEDHKIYTKEGYKKACLLSNNDLLYVLQKIDNNNSTNKKSCKILFKKMFNFFQYREQQLERETKYSSKKSKTENTENMSCMRKIFYGTKGFGKEKKILQHFMFSEMENDYSGNTKQGFHEREYRESENYKKEKLGKESRKSESGIFSEFNKNEIEQPDDESGNSRKNEIKKYWKNFFSKRWKRSVNQTINKIARSYWITSRIRDKYIFCKAFFQKCSESLQGRFSYSRKKDSDRDRWENSQNKKMEVFRQKENGNIEFFRVESVEVLERGSGHGYSKLYSENNVYDLTIDEHHNYFADNVLVSNCHHLKNIHTTKNKNIRDVIEKYPNAKITMLSGTPVRNRVNDVFSYLKLIGHPLGQNYAAFLREYTTTRSGKRGSLKVGSGQNLDDLYRKMSNFMVRKRRIDCFDLPDKMEQKCYFKLEDYKEEYNKAIKDAIKENKNINLQSALSPILVLLGKAKVKGVIEMAEDMINEGKKVVIFSTYVDPLKMLHNHFKGQCVYIDGSINGKDRDALKNKFHEDEECMVLLGQSKACGESIDLAAAASDIITITLPWTHSELEQATSRCDGPKQKNKVSILHTICEDSIEEDLYHLITEKAADSNQLIDRGKAMVDYSNVPELLYKELLKKYNGDEANEADGESIPDNGQDTPRLVDEPQS